MALKEQDIVFTGKDASGNTIIQMPITRAENVEDLTTTCLPLSGGNVTGNLTVQSKNVVRSVNGTAADASGNVTISIPAVPNAYVKASSMVKAGGYMWFSNGFLICWGNAEVSKDATKTVTFAKAYSTVYGITTADFYDTNNSWNFIGTALTNTNATFRSSGMPRTFYYLAYGYAK